MEVGCTKHIRLLAVQRHQRESTDMLPMTLFQCLCRTLRSYQPYIVSVSRWAGTIWPVKTIKHRWGIIRYYVATSMLKRYVILWPAKLLLLLEYVPIRIIKRDNNTIETHNTNKKDIIRELTTLELISQLTIYGNNGGILTQLDKPVSRAQSRLNNELGGVVTVLSP